MDFVITWVKESDPEWQRELHKYKKTDDKATHTARFREWDNLNFWFRGVEKFAPWVDKIHFVTWGHLPDWLNTDHPKLNIVNHKDFIPKSYLPTFNSRPIELNFHRIKALSEHYVYFNDDMFLIDTVDQEIFFKGDNPCDMGLLDIISGENEYSFTIAKDISIIRKNFNKKQTLKEKRSNWFNLKYDNRDNLKNLLLALIRKDEFFGFFIRHLPQPLRKATLKTLWEKEYDAMHESCRHRFRDYTSVNTYLQRYWELASNNFHPIDVKKLGTSFQLGEQKTIKGALNFIKKQKKPLICLNDQIDVDEDSFKKMKTEVQAALAEILPGKSSFEK